MICPKCQSIIPDDSKFCPDCGKIVVNIDEIRLKAKFIYDNYNVGYKYYMNLGVLPHFSSRLKLASYENILEKEADIKHKHQELEDFERQEAIKEKHRKEEEQRIREAASRIVINYAKGYQFMVNNGSLPQYSQTLSATDCKKIISKETVIKQKHQELSEHQENNGMGITIIIVVAIIFGLILAFSGSSDNSSKYEVEYPPEDSVCIEVVEELVEEVAAPEDIFPYGVDSLL